MLPVYRIKSGGQTYFRVDFGLVNGKRMTKTTSDHGEAERWARAGWTERYNHGIAALAVPPQLKEDAVKCADKLKPYAATIGEATTFYIEHVLKYRESPTVAMIVQKMITEKERLNRRTATIKNLRYHLGQFSAHFAARKLAEINLPELKHWVLDPQLTARSQANRLKKISELYNYAVRNDWCSVNLTGKMDRPSVQTEQVGIFSVDDCLRLLILAPKYDLLPYTAFSLFAGIRSGELVRLDWSAFKTDPAIIIGSDAAKKRGQRVVDDKTVWDSLMPWLSPYIQKQGAIAPPNLRTRLKGLAREANVEWKQNGLRHSFCSYHLAAFKHPELTAYLAGNSPTMIQSHYRALITEGEAKRLWALRPGEAENIVVMNAS